MNYQEFSSRIKQKYPQYADMDDEDLARRMVAKYPQYSDVEFGKPLLQRAGEIATAPFRGYRGLAVGLENLATSPTKPAAALQRASEAVRPGFRPAGIGETAASIIGETVPLAPMGGALASGGKAIQALKMGATAAGLTAATEAAETGDIKPFPVLGSAALGAAWPLGAGAVQKIFPPIAGKFTKLPAEAYRGVTTAFKRKFPGTEKAISGISERLSPILEREKDLASQRINDIKRHLGIKLSPKEAIQEVSETRGDPRSLGRIASEFKDIRRRSAKFIEGKKELPIVDPYGRPITIKTQTPGLSRTERVRRLDDLVRDINAETGGSYGEDVFLMKGEIQKEARKAGGLGYQRLQRSYKQYGELKNIEDDLGRQLTDTEGASAEIERLMRKKIEKPASWSGDDQRRWEAVERLEKFSGQSILEPLRNQIVSSYTNMPVSDFIPKGLLGKLALLKFPAEALTAMAAGSPRIMGQVGQMMFNPVGTPGRLGRASSLALISEFIGRRDRR